MIISSARPITSSVIKFLAFWYTPPGTSRPPSSRIPPRTDSTARTARAADTRISCPAPVFLFVPSAHSTPREKAAKYTPAVSNRSQEEARSGKYPAHADRINGRRIRNPAGNFPLFFFRTICQISTSGAVRAAAANPRYCSGI